MSINRVGGRPKGQKTIVTNDQVYYVILDRFTSNPPKPTCRNDVMDALNAGWPLVNDHFDRLETSGRIATAKKGSGYFFPTNVFVDRPVSLTAIHGSRYKGEVGDQCMDMSPRELVEFVGLGYGIARRYGFEPR